MPAEKRVGSAVALSLFDNALDLPSDASTQQSSRLMVFIKSGVFGRRCRAHLESAIADVLELQYWFQAQIAVV